MSTLQVELYEGVYKNRKEERGDAIRAVRAYFERCGWLDEDDYKKSYQAWPAATYILRAKIR